MGRSIYTFEYPFIRKSTFFRPVFAPSEERYLDPDTHRSITAFILKWCAQRDLIEPILSAGVKPMVAGMGSDIPFRASFSENYASFSNKIYNTNMRSLLKRKALEEFLSAVVDIPTSHNWRTDIQHLIVTMSVLYGRETVDAMVNRIYRSYEALPTMDAEFTWEDVHREVPLMWMILLIHITITTYVEPPKVKHV